MEFDPYHRWLGIRKEDQPPDHYRLLGLTRFEDDPEVIRDAAERQMAHVRNYGLGKNAELSQKILSELSVAKTCLLDVSRKDEYNKQLLASSERESSGISINVPRQTPPRPSRTPPPLDTQAVIPVMADEVNLDIPHPDQSPVPQVQAVAPTTSTVSRLRSFFAQSQIRSALLVGGGTFVIFLVLGLIIIVMLTRETDDSPPTNGAPSKESTSTPKADSSDSLDVTSQSDSSTSDSSTSVGTPSTRDKKVSGVNSDANRATGDVVEISALMPNDRVRGDLSEDSSRIGRANPLHTPSTTNTPSVSTGSNTSSSSRSPSPQSTRLPFKLSMVNEEWESTAKTMIEKSSAYDLLHNKLPEDLLTSRSKGEEVVGLFCYPNKSLQTLARFKSGILEGHVISFYDTHKSISFRRVRTSSSRYTYIPTVDWHWMHPISYACYSSGRLNGWLQMWNADQTRHYWCQYIRGRRHGYSCYFEKDQPRLITQFTKNDIEKVFVVVNGHVDREFESEESTREDPVAGPLLKKAIGVSEKWKQSEIDLKKDVKELDTELARMMVAILNPLKRKAMQDRINQRAEHKDNAFRALWERGRQSP